MIDTQQRGVPLDRSYEKIYTTKKRYIFLTGGRGSLKSTAVHDFAARLSYEPGHGILITRYTMSSASISIIPEFMEAIRKLGTEHHFKITRSRIINKKTKSFIHFSGILAGSKNQTANLKSMTGITTWIVEEGEEFNDEKAFNDIDNSIRSTNQKNRVIFIMNPTTKEHFIYKRWIEPSNKKIKVDGFDVTVSNLPEVEHIHTTFKVAGQLNFLAKDWVEKADRIKKKLVDQLQVTTENWTRTAEQLEFETYKIRHNSEYYHTYVGGWKEKEEGVIFDNWQEGAFDESLAYCYGLDYGYNPDPLAMGRVAINERKRWIHIKQIIYDTEVNDIPARLTAEGIHRKDLIVCDTNEPRTTYNIQKKGFNIEPAIKGKGSIAEDIREIKEYMIIVDPESNDVKRELNNYAWNDKKASIPKEGFDHLMDQMRYAFRKLRGGRNTGVSQGN